MNNKNSTPSSDSQLPFGVLDTDYHEGRLKKRQLIYRLQRRTLEVAEAIERYAVADVGTIVDIGTADALMLKKLRERIRCQTCIGFDYSLKLMQTTNLPGIAKVQADALALPLMDDCADVAITTAVIEHVPDPGDMIQEIARVLRPAGLLVLTTPDPFMEKVASTLGLLKDPGHQETLNLSQLRALAQQAGFEVVSAKKFMFSPVGFPWEYTIEGWLDRLGLDTIMANQLLVARRPAH